MIIVKYTCVTTFYTGLLDHLDVTLRHAKETITDQFSIYARIEDDVLVKKRKGTRTVDMWFTLKFKGDGLNFLKLKDSHLYNLLEDSVSMDNVEYEY